MSTEISLIMHPAFPLRDFQTIVLGVRLMQVDNVNFCDFSFFTSFYSASA